MYVAFKVFHLRDSKVFYGGDEVTGFLEVKGPLAIPDATVKITFRGIAKTEQQVRNRTMKDKQIFFQTNQELFKGAIDIEKDAIQTFPFKLLLPEQTAPSWGEPQIRYSGKKEIFALAPHPIPPSTALSGNFMRPWAAQVYYELRAEVKGKLALRKTEGMVTVAPSPAQTKLALQRADTEHDAQSKTFTHSSTRLLEGKETERRSMKTWFGDKFSSTSPKAVFSFTARTATTLSAGQGIPIQITLNYDRNASNLASIPDFRLIQLKYKLKGITNSVARGFLAPEMHIREYSTVFKRQIQFAQMALVDGQALDIGMINTEQGGVQYIPLNTALVTPFVTYNIARAYAVEIEIVFECGGKQMTAKFKWDSVDIVFNEGYHLKAATQFGSDDGQTVTGAAAAATALGVTAMVIATLLGG
jgi:hypothetical protein